MPCSLSLDVRSGLGPFASVEAAARIAVGLGLSARIVTRCEAGIVRSAQAIATERGITVYVLQISEQSIHLEFAAPRRLDSALPH